VSQQLHMGELDEHTVCEAEVVSTILALDIICSQPQLHNITILLDNQAAIKNVHHPKEWCTFLMANPASTSSTPFTPNFASCLRRSLTYAFTLHGSLGVELNELSDAKAKEAATGTSTALSHKVPTLSRPLPRSAAALKAMHKKSLASAW
ncbi:hypothetical protein K439DRAFT_1292432, partial [Ramaria rubella]